jgi:hypothetical protein
MDVLGMIFLAVVLGHLFAPLEAVGAWFYDRRYNR